MASETYAECKNDLIIESAIKILSGILASATTTEMTAFDILEHRRWGELEDEAIKVARSVYKKVEYPK